jgi:tRNA U34 5-methylaminomethyl-2-thiouridine-forming methyltransferase MnmC
MMNPSPYRIVQLANGSYSIHSLAHGETFHPVIGPVAEAEALYVRQLELPVRLRRHAGEFVIWDVGLGAAANPLTVLRATGAIACTVKLISFDRTLAPLHFALAHRDVLPYLSEYESHLRTLLEHRRVCFQNDRQSVDWELHVTDFPSLLAQPLVKSIPAPHAILFDAFSPAKNPAMWTQPLFASLYRLLDPQRPCALPTYSRSTMLRVSLLLAGFFVGAGQATGEKEETTIAANSLELISEPLGRDWLQRAHRSTSAEPLWEPVYRQARLSPATWEALQQHPQFR